MCVLRLLLNCCVSRMSIGIFLSDQFSTRYDVARCISESTYSFDPFFLIRSINDSELFDY